MQELSNNSSKQSQETGRDFFSFILKNTYDIALSTTNRHSLFDFPKIW